jgi:hypothetical protein
VEINEVINLGQNLVCDDSRYSFCEGAVGGMGLTDAKDRFVPMPRENPIQVGKVHIVFIGGDPRSPGKRERVADRHGDNCPSELRRVQALQTSLDYAYRQVFRTVNATGDS